MDHQHNHDLSYEREIEHFRKKREQTLRAPDGWLTLTGLFMLTDGVHTVGSAASSNVVLPASAPAHLGVIEFRDNRATLRVTASDPVQVDGTPVREVALEDNSHGQPTLVWVGPVHFFIHHFGDQYAVRVKDTAHPARTVFAGNAWFPVRPEFRLKGKFTRFDAVRAVPINTVRDVPSEFQASGEIAFQFDGRSFSLLAQDMGTAGDRLHIIFRDMTSGKQTYGLVRFLTVTVEADGTVDLDFNRAVNPPCAFSPFATCPLPPRQNILAVAIEAGEQYSAAAKDIYAYQLDQAHVSHD